VITNNSWLFYPKVRYPKNNFIQWVIHVGNHNQVGKISIEEMFKQRKLSNGYLFSTG